MRVVLDTNVPISAFISHTGAPAQIFALWRNGEIEILVSPESLAELQRVLTYPRVQRYLQYSPEQIERR
jgi:putative PIN family toxin of toxin-antitoxin system